MNTVQEIGEIGKGTINKEIRVSDINPHFNLNEVSQI